jgi:hypothetical protein
LSQLEPCEKIFAKLLDLGINRDRDGIQEIQSEVVGYEKRWRALD